MVRVQIQLDMARHRQLKRQARRMGVSVAELVRQYIDGVRPVEAHGDAAQERVRRALAVAGKYRDPNGATTIARDHDAALADAYES